MVTSRQVLQHFCKIIGLLSFNGLPVSLFVSLIIMAPTAAFCVEMSKALDVVLMVDSSPSTKTTDPQNQRVVAAEMFLRDYLESVGEAFEVNQRVAVVNFGGKVGTAVPLRFVQSFRDEDFPPGEAIPFTDFRPPLEFAWREFSSLTNGSGRKMAAVLFTDGRPQLSSKELSDKEARKVLS